MRKPPNVTLDLTEINGNAFAILGAFQRQARKEGWAADEISAVLNEARAGDYNHLLQTIIAHTQSPDEEQP